MIVNIVRLKEILKKATLNYSINSVRLDITKDTITSKMISDSRDAVVILSTPNDMLLEMKEEEYSWNFSEPNSEVRPYIESIDDEEATIEVFDNRILLNNQANIHFHDPSIISVFSKEQPAKNVEYFAEIAIDGDFDHSFKKVKKIGSRFEKIYFTVDNGKLFIETTDKKNVFSNGFKDEIADVDKKDLSLCFNYKNMVNLMKIIEDGGNFFNLKLTYMDDHDLGMLFAFNRSGESNENYYLMSIQE